jgi:hypothetical protein
MIEQRDDGVTFVPFRAGYEAAFLGTVMVGAVRAEPCGWTLTRGTGGADWQRIDTLDNARAAVRRRVAEFYDALHTPLEAGQGERLAERARLA